LKERREQIKKYISTKDFVSLTELSDMFPSVSTMTLRRDLDFLESEGNIIRTKGGAKSINALSIFKEEAYNKREFVNPHLKEEIGKKVVSLINDGECVFFDAGSTVMQIAKQIGQKHLFAVTNGPNIAMELTKNLNCDINVVCGKLNRDNISLSGLHAVDFLEGINISTAVIAASGYTSEHGFTCGGYDDSRLKNAVIKKAGRVIVVMDETKFGANHPFTFAGAEDIDIFVTNSACEKAHLADFEKNGVTII